MKTFRLCIIRNREHNDVMNKFMKLNSSWHIVYFKSYLLTDYQVIIALEKIFWQGFCVCFLCGIVSVSKLCFDSYEYTSKSSHERPFHRRNRLLFLLLYMLLILCRCFFLMISGLWNCSYFVNNFVKRYPQLCTKMIWTSWPCWSSISLLQSGKVLHLW